MVSEQTLNVAQRAKRIYAERLQNQLEADHFNDFVAIEPDSGDYFLGHTMSEAVQAARKTYSDRITFVIRVGHETAIHIGLMG